MRDWSDLATMTALPFPQNVDAADAAMDALSALSQKVADIRAIAVLEVVEQFDGDRQKASYALNMGLPAVNKAVLRGRRVREEKFPL